MMQLDNKSPWMVGLFQAIAIILYIVLFAVTVQTIDTLKLFTVIPEKPIFIIPLMLTTFVFSALVCGGSALGYPLVLLFHKQTARAITIICWTGCWLAACLGTYLLTALLVAGTAVSGS